MDSIISVVDDDDAIRESLKGLLTGAGYRVRCYSSAERFLDRMRDGEHGCALVDVKLPGMDGIALQDELNSRVLGVPTVLLSGYASIPLAVRAMRLGAASFIAKPLDPERVLSEVQRCARVRDEPGDPGVDARSHARRLAILTPRERTIARGLIEGLTNRQIGSYLGISKRTVESHGAHIFGKLHIGWVATLTQLAYLAMPHYQAGAERRGGRELDPLLQSKSTIASIACAFWIQACNESAKA